MFASCGALGALLRALEASNAAETMQLFGALLEFARRGETDVFLTDEFLGRLNDSINQHYSTPAPEAFRFVSLLTPIGWRTLLGFGLFEMIIDLADRVVFANKRWILFVLLGLIECSGLEPMLEAGLADDIFRIICRSVGIGEKEILPRLFAVLIQFLRVGSGFVSIAVEEELAATASAAALGDAHVEEILAILIPSTP
jgi:hypothetical protein